MADLNALIAQGAQFNLPNPVDQYSKVMQLQSAQQQMQLNRQQMQQIQEDRAGFAKLRETLAQQNLTPEQYEVALTQSPDSRHQQMGVEMRMRRTRLAELEKAMGGAEPVGAPSAMPAPMVAPEAPKPNMFVTKDNTGRPRYIVDATEVSPEDYQSAQANVMASPVRSFGQPEPQANALASRVAPAVAAAPVANAMVAQPPVAAPVGNAMTSKQAQLDEINRKLAVLTKPQFSDVAGVKDQIAYLREEQKRLSENKYHVVDGNLVDETGKAIFTAPPKVSTPAEVASMQALGYPLTQEGFRAYREAQRPDRLLTPEEEAQRLRLAKAGATNVSVNAGQKAEDVEFGRYVVDQYKTISDQARLAAKSLPAIDINLRTLDKGFDTGFGTETKAAGASVLAALGVKDAAQYATDAQTFLANANSAVLQKQIEQKGPQTESDAQRINATGAQLGNTKEANRFILNVAKAQLQRDIDQRKFYSDWQSEHGTFKGAEAAWASGPGSASLFDTPALKKYTAPAPAAGQTETRKAGLDKIFGGAR